MHKGVQLEFCLFGAGRIAKIHAANTASHPNAHLRYVVDINAHAAEQLAASYGAVPLTSPEQALSDPAVDAVIIASPTSTHLELITLAANAGKAIFCEKPIDLDLERTGRCIEAVARAGVPFMLGFNRRFDPNFAALRQAIRNGSIGQLETLSIISRDPAPPPADYLRTSGGMFLDMSIHDFDMACWLFNEPAVEIYAQASCLVDRSIHDAGDIDTAVVTMRMASGALCQIHNSRRAVYGYDQRIEAFGSLGMVQAGNRNATTLMHWLPTGIAIDPPLPFFLERYADAYRMELDYFIRGVMANALLEPNAEDGYRALWLALAATRSSATQQPVVLT